MILGLFLGFLLGAGVAAMMAKEAEAPGRDGESTAEKLDDVKAGAEGLVSELRRRYGEARQAARMAAEEKRAELNRQLDEAIHKAGQDSSARP